jgi:cytosine/adenosine deaminase-related metal-dependent hydrolase
MSFKKFKGKALFIGTEMLDENHVLVTDETGVIQEIISADEAGTDVQKLDGIICPGFVNAHCHLELSHMKGVIPPETGMVPFLMQVMGNRFGDKDRIQQAIADTEMAMLQNGIVAVGDICNVADTIAAKQKGRLHYYNFIEVSGFVPASAGARLAVAKEVAAQFEAAFPKEQVSITPHAPYSVSTQMFQLINELPGNDLLSLHNQESIAENQFFIKKEGDFLKLFSTIGVDLSFYDAPGKNSLPAICSNMDFAKQWLLVHNCLTTAQDIKDSCLPQQEVYFCLCPGANIYIGNPLPDVMMLKETGMPVCIGTDSLASNTQLSILAEMALLQENFPALQLVELLQWATLNGAKALKAENRFGSFEKGKQPGVLVLENMDGKMTDATVVKRIL